MTVQSSDGMPTGPNFLGAPPIYCEHCDKLIQGVHCVMSSLEEDDFNRTFFVCLQCMGKRYIKQGKVAEC